jgi:hypothetical protein
VADLRNDSLNLVDKILRADELRNRLQALLNDRQHVIRNNRDEMCLLHWSLVGDHHSGILLLLHHQNYAPAFALVRPLIEAFVRLFVVIHGTEAQLAAVKNGSYRPEFTAVAKQIDELYAAALDIHVDLALACRRNL